ncbi:probable palmitoyltransferase ZDHHC24 [Pieris napi]|uniref:probable palmitoyltransferase ZDHHC24 n=1 Tax=Pieris napi TaxID=78633 RepID=UPI001FBAD952|nr:probable palmitoyltransferase ZDHHC24 [Pieris napi]
MIFKFAKISARVYEKVICYALVYVITPCFFIFEMALVRPIVIKHYNYGILLHAFHVICGTFCFLNVVGNMIMSIFTNTSVNKSVRVGESYCDTCKIIRPAKAWHCKLCNVCILRRDHHCFFLSRCIGLYNQRYFILYLTYILISLIYSAIYNYYFVLTRIQEYDLVLSLFRIFNPFFRYMSTEPPSIKDVYVLFLCLNGGLIFWSGLLFIYHVRNAMSGVVARDSRLKRRLNMTMLKNNLMNIFGTRWYLAIVWPFAESPLPQEYVMKNI